MIGEAGDGETAVRLAAELAPDVIVMDVQMPGMNGIEATRRIVSNFSVVGRPVIIASSADAASEQAMLEAGASGFVSKDRVQ